MDKKDSNKRLQSMGKLIREEEEKMMAAGVLARALETDAWQQMKDALARIGVKTPKGKRNG
jgi:hypothetical protein